jgi:hypothetical protein
MSLNQGVKVDSERREGREVGRRKGGMRWDGGRVVGKARARAGRERGGDDGKKEGGEEKHQ